MSNGLRFLSVYDSEVTRKGNSCKKKVKSSARPIGWRYQRGASAVAVGQIDNQFEFLVGKEGNVF